MQIISKGGVVEAPPDGMDGPRWIATLNNGSVIVGRPSWLSSGPNINLPYNGASDWQRLQERLRENTNEEIIGLTLWIPNLGRWEAPRNKGGYGYSEQMTIGNNGLTTKAGVSALSIYWVDKDSKIKCIRVSAAGVLEHWTYHKWLPCMIGDQQAYASNKDRGVKV